MEVQEISLEHLEEAFRIEEAAHAFAWPKTIFEKQLAKAHCNFGIFDHNTLRGFACIRRILPEAELLNIAIAPTAQGQGLGEKLLLTLIALLKSERYQSCFLEVRASNHAAIKLYTRLGFCQLGERKNYYPTHSGREDAYLYGIELCF